MLELSRKLNWNDRGWYQEKYSIIIIVIIIIIIKITVYSEYSYSRRLPRKRSLCVNVFTEHEDCSTSVKGNDNGFLRTLSFISLGSSFNHVIRNLLFCSSDNPTYRKTSDGIIFLTGPGSRKGSTYSDHFPTSAPPRPPPGKRGSVEGHINPALSLKEDVVTMNPLYEENMLEHKGLDDRRNGLGSSFGVTPWAEHLDPRRSTEGKENICTTHPVAPMRMWSRFRWSDFGVNIKKNCDMDGIMFLWNIRSCEYLERND